MRRIRGDILKDKRKSDWLMNGYYQRRFKYAYTFFKDMRLNPHRKLYNGLKTVTQAEV
jgi:hypothetical protein